MSHAPILIVNLWLKIERWSCPANWSTRGAIFSGSLIPGGGCHERKRYTDDQTAFALRQAESGTSVEEICRKLGVSEPTFSMWKKQFAGTGVLEIRRLKQLEEESAKLKRFVADLTLDTFSLGRGVTG